MPFCPECKCEYRPGFDKCADCGVWLVDTLEEASQKGRDRHYRPSTTSSREPEYSDDIKKIMKSLPSGPSIPKGPIGPGRSGGTRPSGVDSSPDPNDEIARKLEKHDTWIEIAHFPSDKISHMVGDALESNQIPFVVFPGFRGGEYWGGYAGGIYENEGDDILLVPEQYVEQADEIALGVLGEIYESYKTPNG